ncbi:glycosyltransferase [Sphingomicrobium sp. XHP0235]|uniref:glycosyltransferase n=1 Tax=Sphingomicrobium aquimarinum TaxID=3133971 RepID=UPI0031FF1842
MKGLPRIAVIATAPFVVRAHLVPHLRALTSLGQVTLFCNTVPGELDDVLPDGVQTVPVALRRPIAPLADVRALRELTRKLRQGGYDVVQTFLPKSGLLGQVAARRSGVPVRLHHFGGQVWFTRSGAMRRLLKTMDKLMARNATAVSCDGPSQRAFIAAQGIHPDARYFGPKGSLRGVDTGRFAPDAAARADIRARLSLEEDAMVIGYCGRLNADKGVPELLRAFATLAKDRDHLHLLLVGPDEDEISGDVAALDPAIRRRVHLSGLVIDPARWMAAFDIAAHPSHREGFGLVAIEANACGVPVVASRIVGLEDAIEGGEGGAFHEAGDVEGLVDALAPFIDDDVYRKEQGERGRARAKRLFDEALIVGDYCAFLTQAAASRGVRLGD